MVPVGSARARPIPTMMGITGLTHAKLVVVLYTHHNEIWISGIKQTLQAFWCGKTLSIFDNEHISVKGKAFVLCSIYNLKASISLCWSLQSYTLLSLIFVVQTSILGTAPCIIWEFDFISILGTAPCHIWEFDFISILATAPCHIWEFEFISILATASCHIWEFDFISILATAPCHIWEFDFISILATAPCHIWEFDFISILATAPCHIWEFDFISILGAAPCHIWEFDFISVIVPPITLLNKHKTWKK